MTDWKLLAIALAFVAYMARLRHVNRRAMKFAGLLVCALAGYSTVPLLTAGLAGPARYSGVDAQLGPGPGPGGGGVLSIFRRGGGTTPASQIGPPNAPNCTATVFAPTGDSLRIVCSAFVGSGNDTHAATAILVDTAGGGWNPPQYFADTLGAVITDTIPALDSASFVDILVAYQGASGQWSDYDTILAVEMVQGASLYPNMPAGMSPITQWDGTSATVPSGWTGNLGGCGSVEADGVTTTNPLGTGSSLKIGYVSGSGGQCGTGPTIDWGSGYDTVYVSYRIYIDPNWNQNAGQKIFFLFQNGGTSTTAYYYTREAIDVTNVAMHGQDNLGQPTHIDDTDFWNGARGNWVNIEFVFVAETTYNSSDDARVTVYKNGTQTSTAFSYGIMGDITGLEWYLERNANHTQTEYFLIGEFAAWGK